MTITLARRLKDGFIRQMKDKPMWTIPEIEGWLRRQNEFQDSRMLAETKGGFQGSQTVSSKAYELQDGSVVRISNDGIEEVTM